MHSMDMRKGITPVLAVVMLIMITIAGAGAVWTLYENFLHGAPDEGPNVRITNLKVEECWKAPGQTNLMIRNGNPEAIDTSHINVYINGSLDETATFHGTGPNDIVGAQDSFQLEINQRLTRATEIRIATTSNSIDYRC